MKELGIQNFKDSFIELMKSRGFFSSLVSIFVLIIFLLFSNGKIEDVILYLLFLLFNTFFDILGYQNLMQSQDINSYAYTNFKGDELSSYRIMQYLFLIASSYVFIDLTGNPYSLVVILISEFSAIKDILYYILTYNDFPVEWSWLRFSFVGWFTKKITNKLAITQALLAFLVCIILIVL